MLGKIIKGIENVFKPKINKEIIKVDTKPKRTFKTNKSITLVCVERLRIKNKYETDQEVVDRLAKLDLEEFIKIGKSELPYTESELSALDVNLRNKRGGKLR